MRHVYDADDVMWPEWPLANRVYLWRHWKQFAENDLKGWPSWKKHYLKWRLILQLIPKYLKRTAGNIKQYKSFYVTDYTELLFQNLTTRLSVWSIYMMIIYMMQMTCYLATRKSGISLSTLKTIYRKGYEKVAELKRALLKMKFYIAINLHLFKSTSGNINPL